MITTRNLILRAHRALDPERRNVGWPDPIKWDGRPIREQAADMAALLDVEGLEPELAAELWRRARGGRQVWELLRDAAGSLDWVAHKHGMDYGDLIDDLRRLSSAIKCRAENRKIHRWHQEWDRRKQQHIAGGGDERR